MPTSWAGAAHCATAKLLLSCLLVLLLATTTTRADLDDDLKVADDYGYDNVWESEEGWFVSRGWIYDGIDTLRDCTRKCKAVDAPGGSYGYDDDPKTCYCDQTTDCLEPIVVLRGATVFSRRKQPDLCEDGKDYCEVFKLESKDWCSRPGLERRTDTESPTPGPTSGPTTPDPTRRPTPSPTPLPTTIEPTPRPTQWPTQLPTRDPTKEPTPEPTEEEDDGDDEDEDDEKEEPTVNPTEFPTVTPTEHPTPQPTSPNPTAEPTREPPSPPSRTEVVDLSPFIMDLNVDVPESPNDGDGDAAATTIDLTDEEEARLVSYTTQHLTDWYRSNLGKELGLDLNIEVILRAYRPGKAHLRRRAESLRGGPRRRRRRLRSGGGAGGRDDGGATLRRKFMGRMILRDVPTDDGKGGRRRRTQDNGGAVASPERIDSLTESAFRGVGNARFLVLVSNGEERVAEEEGGDGPGGGVGVLGSVTGAQIEPVREDDDGERFEDPTVPLDGPSTAAESGGDNDDWSESWWLGIDKKTWLIVGCVVGAFGVGICLGLAALCLLRRRRKGETGEASGCCCCRPSKPHATFELPKPTPGDQKGGGGTMELDLGEHNKKHVTDDSSQRVLSDNDLLSGSAGGDESTAGESYSPERAACSSSTTMSSPERMGGSDKDLMSKKPVSSFEEMQDEFYDGPTPSDESSEDDSKWCNGTLGGQSRTSKGETQEAESVSSIGKIIAEALGEDLAEKEGKLMTVKENDVASFADFTVLDEDRFNKVLQFDRETGRPVRKSFNAAAAADTDADGNGDSPASSEIAAAAVDGNEGKPSEPTRVSTSNFESVWNEGNASQSASATGAEAAEAEGSKAGQKKDGEQLLPPKVEDDVEWDKNDDDEDDDACSLPMVIDLTTPRRISNSADGKKQRYGGRGSAVVDRRETMASPDSDQMMESSQSVSTMGMFSAYAPERALQEYSLDQKSMQEVAEAPSPSSDGLENDVEEREGPRPSADRNVGGDRGGNGVDAMARPPRPPPRLNAGGSKMPPGCAVAEGEVLNGASGSPTGVHNLNPDDDVAKGGCEKGVMDGSSSHDVPLQEGHDSGNSDDTGSALLVSPPEILRKSPSTEDEDIIVNTKEEETQDRTAPVSMKPSAFHQSNQVTHANPKNASRNTWRIDATSTPATENDKDESDGESNTGWDDADSAMFSGPCTMKQHQQSTAAVETATYQVIGDLDVTSTSKVDDDAMGGMDGGGPLYRDFVESPLPEDDCRRKHHPSNADIQQDEQSTSTNYFAMQKHNFARTMYARSETSSM